MSHSRVSAQRDAQITKHNRAKEIFEKKLFDILQLLATVVPTREIFFQPDIEADEEVATAHFLDLELGGAGAAVAPSDGDGGKTEPTDDGFEREFDRDVEMRGEDGADAVDDRAAVGFEGVRGVVEAVAKEDADEEVCGAVERELEGRIVDHSAVLQEATAEDAVVAFIEGLPVANDIAAIIGFVGHHNNHGITGHGVETLGDRTPEAVRTGILDRAEGGDFGGFALEDLPSGVGGTVVHHDDFMGNAA